MTNYIVLKGNCFYQKDVPNHNDILKKQIYFNREILVPDLPLELHQNAIQFIWLKINYLTMHIRYTR